MIIENKGNDTESENKSERSKKQNKGRGCERPFSKTGLGNEEAYFAHCTYYPL